MIKAATQLSNAGLSATFAGAALVATAAGPIGWCIAAGLSVAAVSRLVPLFN